MEKTLNILVSKLKKEKYKFRNLKARLMGLLKEYQEFKPVRTL